MHLMQVTCNKISQAENDSVSQYLMHVKDYLEHINHTNRLSSKDSSRINHISFIQGLSDSYVRRRASKEAENWRTLGDAFYSITKIAKTAGKTKAYSEPRYEVSTDVNIILQHTNSQSGSFSRYQGSCRSNSNRTNIQKGNNPPKQSNTKEPTCYHYEGPHYVTNCAKYQQDKGKYKQTKQQVKKIYQNRLKLGVKIYNVSINKAYFKNEEDDNPGNYSEEQAEVLCELLDNDSE